MTAFHRVAEFDLWRPGYGGASVEVLIAGTTTRAALYSDTALTAPLENPQILQAQTGGDGRTYGRFLQPVYTASPYALRIDSSEQTGVQRLPLVGLAGEDASEAIVTATGGSAARALEDHLAAEVRVENFGGLDASASANTAILTAAIGAAAAQGGGQVMLPAGNFPFTQLSLPQDVILVGKGRGATTLRSEQAQEVITIAGNGAGLRGMTLDGVNLNTGSIGVFAVGRDRVKLEDVIIKRFAQGILARGGERHRYREAYVQNCTKGADLRGDRDALFTNTGGPFLDLEWMGGSVETCSAEGLRLSFEDDPVTRSTIRGVKFDSNTGVATIINGARTTTFEACRWDGNGGALAVTDDNDLSRVDQNTIQQLLFWNCAFVGGTLSFNGLCEDVRFDGCDLSDVDWVLSVPTLPILLLDCTEDSLTTATGALDRLMRNSSHKVGEFPGVTTDDAWTTAWQTEMDPGTIMQIIARIIGNQRNGINAANYTLGCIFRRPGSELSFSAASATLTAGTVVAGDTSGAEARVTAVSGTTSGTLTLRAITGAFINGEALTFSDAKTATAASALVPAAAALEGQNTSALAYESDAAWNVQGAVTGGSAQVQVRGGTGQTVEWLLEVDVLRP